MAIKNIIFDLGGVILTHKSTLMEEIISKMFSLPRYQAKKIWGKYKHRLFTLETNSKKFLKEVKLLLKSSMDLETLWRLWRGLYIKGANVDQELLRLIKQLKKNYHIYLMSDTIDIHDEINARRGVYDAFDDVFVSFKERLRKPHPEAFKNVLKKTKSKPEETVFIDDLEENVKKAEELKMKGIVYKNLKQLKKDLVELGAKF